MAERKKSAKKAPAKKKTKAGPTASTPARPAKKKAAARKKPAAKKPASTAAKPQAEPVAPPAPAKPPVPGPPPGQAGTISADDVLLGHVMGLRPRIHVGFKRSAFADAKRALADARYATLEQAARAVAEKAIEISNDSSLQDPFSRR